MTINYYRVGQKVRVTCTFKVNDVLTDPTAVVCKVMDPSRNVTTETATKSSTGLYYVDVIADETREWSVRFEGSGACTAVEEITFGANTRFP